MANESPEGGVWVGSLVVEEQPRAARAAVRATRERERQSIGTSDKKRG